MTFTTMLKEELSKIKYSTVERKIETLSYIKNASKIEEIKIIITSENASVIRKMYTNLKEVFNLKPNIIIRKEKRFKLNKQIYILEVKEGTDFLIKELNSFSSMIDSKEEVVSYLEGAFLAAGSITDPKVGKYHLEYSLKEESESRFINKLLISLGFNSKITKRKNKYIVYIKSGEEISDLLKLLKVFNSLFYFEDIRIYKDHKNMVNRLNNCELANYEKVVKTGLDQVKMIKLLKELNLFNLLDENTKLVAGVREKNPESSFSELSKILEKEHDYIITKSGINHHFIKIKKLYKKGSGYND